MQPVVGFNISRGNSCYAFKTSKRPTIAATSCSVAGVTTTLGVGALDLIQRSYLIASQADITADFDS